MNYDGCEKEHEAKSDSRRYFGWCTGEKSKNKGKMVQDSGEVIEKKR